MHPLRNTSPFKAPCGDNPKQNLGTIHASNPEHILLFKALRGVNPEQNAGTIHASNQEHLLVFKAPREDDPEQNAGKIHASNQENHFKGGRGWGGGGAQWSNLVGQVDITSLKL